MPPSMMAKHALREISESFVFLLVLEKEGGFSLLLF